MLDPASVESLVNVAAEAARAAGRLLLERSALAEAPIGIRTRDVKLESDMLADALIVKILQEATPYSLVSEEQGAVERGTGLRWVIDPLDGTVNFSRGLPLWSISIALWDDAEPVLGVVYVPPTGELYTGVVGMGAKRSGQPICVSKVEREERAVLMTGMPVASDFSEEGIRAFIGHARRFGKTRLLGSAALSLCHVASGVADAYIERSVKLWDIAAGCAIVLAAGGVIDVRLRDANLVDAFASNGYLVAAAADAGLAFTRTLPHA
jgi:myo-inositol-1(or 4)-monophosphatase